MRLWSRLGNEKTAQFPEIAAALERWGRRQKAAGRPGRRDRRARREGRADRLSATAGTHSSDGGTDIASPSIRSPTLRSTCCARVDTDLRERPFAERRAALERVFGRTGSPILRISEIAHGSGRALYKRALASGWEGLIAKHVESRYRSGKRTPDWRKLKIVHEQEFVIGGWTEPRQTRAYFGALLLGVYEDEPADTRSAKGRISVAAGSLVYVGHTGTGFNERELARADEVAQAARNSREPVQRPAAHQ